jgi:acyl transferase domain-containing protein
MIARGGHFLEDDPASFDAPFFSITAKEAAAMDPQHRCLLEISYLALENGT